jgi:hypothetical protein
MASNPESVPLIVKIHNVTCPAWILNIGFLKNFEPGCQLAAKHISTK